MTYLPNQIWGGRSDGYGGYRMVPTCMHVNYGSGVDYVLAKYHSN